MDLKEAVGWTLNPHMRRDSDALDFRASKALLDFARRAAAHICDVPIMERDGAALSAQWHGLVREARAAGLLD